MTEQTDAEIWARWKAELDFAEKDPKYKAWLDRSEKIVKRYRDDRSTATLNQRRLNILWSNVQTLLPAVFAKGPKPIVERRFMDRDPAARLASTILERCLSVQIETGYFYESVTQAVMDHLIPGMGQAWVRYEPQFEPEQEAALNAKVESQEQTAQQIEQEGDGAPYEKLSSERVCVDYVYYRDFLWGSARYWREVPWVRRRYWLTTSEIAEKFYDGDMEAARKINLDFQPDRKGQDEKDATYFKKAEIVEIWNKADQTVYILAPGTADIILKKEPKPVLQLEGFWPCAEPLFATQTNDTIVPVPDYIEYQDQAQELDDLTGRIAALTTALRVSGVYDASVPALARLLQDGTDNKLIPVDNWAAFAEKGGVAGAISLVPLKEIAETLIGLYGARQQVKGDLYEVTGMSDIVRGQGEKDETATAQRIKGQFASMRLEDRRNKVNLFVRSIIRIMAEIISEMFSPETLLQMSGVDLMIQDDVRKAVEAVPQPQPPPMESEVSAPVDPMQQQIIQQQMAQQFQMAQQQAAQQAQQKGMAEFDAAVKILKSDKLRGFRVDIETDSTIVSDAAADKEAATQLLAGTTEALTAMGPIVMQEPALMKPMGDLLMFAFRRFRVGRTVEASLEDALDQINQKIEDSKGQPPPPSPEQIKADAEMAKQQAETERLQQKAALEQRQGEQDAKLEEFKAGIEAQTLKLKAETQAQIEQMKLAVAQANLRIKEQELAMKEREMVISAQLKEREASMNAEAADHSHRLDMETAEVKAKAAQKPKDDK